MQWRNLGRCTRIPLLPRGHKCQKTISFRWSHRNHKLYHATRRLQCSDKQDRALTSCSFTSRSAWQGIPATNWSAWKWVTFCRRKCKEGELWDTDIRIASYFLLFLYRFVRAVAYRWVVRWLCGYMGWDNRRPLPACIYHNIRCKFPTNNTRGYTAAQARD